MLTQTTAEVGGLIGEVYELRSREVAEVAGQSVAVAVPRQPRNEHVVATGVELLAERTELHGAAGDAMQEDHGAVRSRAMVQQDRMAGGVEAQVCALVCLERVD